MLAIDDENRYRAGMTLTPFTCLPGPRARPHAQQTLAKANAERAERLFKDGMIAQSNVDDARTALEVAEANAAAAKVQLDKTRIRAPFAGMIGRRRISPGAYVRAGDVIA